MKRIFQYILLVLAFVINAVQWIIIFTVAYGTFIITEGLFHAILFDSPEISHWNIIAIKTINIATTALYLGGIGLGVIIPWIFKIKLQKRVLITWIITAIPILLIVIRLLIFPVHNNFQQYSSKGYIWRTYTWHTDKGDFIKIWRSEKCDTCYNRKERIKWDLIEKGYKDKLYSPL